MHYNLFVIDVLYQITLNVIFKSCLCNYLSPNEKLLLIMVSVSDNLYST